MHKKYNPNQNDLAFRNYIFSNSNINPFDLAIQLRKVSFEYLSVICHDNPVAGIRAQVELELARRINQKTVFWAITAIVASVAVGFLTLM